MEKLALSSSLENIELELHRCIERCEWLENEIAEYSRRMSEIDERIGDEWDDEAESDYQQKIQYSYQIEKYYDELENMSHTDIYNELCEYRNAMIINMQKMSFIASMKKTVVFNNFFDDSIKKVTHIYTMFELLNENFGYEIPILEETFFDISSVYSPSSDYQALSYFSHENRIHDENKLQPIAPVGDVKQNITLTQEEKSAFMGGQYTTVRAVNDMYLYRTCTDPANRNGRFATVEKIIDPWYSREQLPELDVLLKSAQYEEELFVPAGTRFCIGKAASITTPDGHVLQGGGTRILLPKDWQTETSVITVSIRKIDKRTGGFLDFSKITNIPYTKRISMTPNRYGSWSNLRGESVWTSNNEKVKTEYRKYGVKGIQYKVGIPDFAPVCKYSFKLPEKAYDSSDAKQFLAANIMLRKEILCNIDRAHKIFTEKQIDDIMKGRKPRGFTWHHDATVGMLQLVPTLIHRNSRHYGGRSIWGGGTLKRWTQK